MAKDKRPPEPIVKGEALEEPSGESPMDRFKSLARRLARVSKQELDKEKAKHKKRPD